MIDLGPRGVGAFFVFFQIRAIELLKFWCQPRKSGLWTGRNEMLKIVTDVLHLYSTRRVQVSGLRS